MPKFHEIYFFASNKKMARGAIFHKIQTALHRKYSNLLMI